MHRDHVLLHATFKVYSSGGESAAGMSYIVQLFTVQKHHALYTHQTFSFVFTACSSARCAYMYQSPACYSSTESIRVVLFAAIGICRGNICTDSFEKKKSKVHVLLRWHRLQLLTNTYSDNTKRNGVAEHIPAQNARLRYASIENTYTWWWMYMCNMLDHVDYIWTKSFTRLLSLHQMLCNRYILADWSLRHLFLLCVPVWHKASQALFAFGIVTLFAVLIVASLHLCCRCCQASLSLKRALGGLLIFGGKTIYNKNTKKKPTIRYISRVKYQGIVIDVLHVC